jgi:hypothetical protein
MEKGKGTCCAVLCGTEETEEKKKKKKEEKVSSWTAIHWGEKREKENEEGKR